LSQESIYEVSYTGDPAVEVDQEDRYEMESRLGEVAIICLGGWIDFDTGEFHPLTMGVRRHVNVAPGAHVPDLNIWLNIPLSGQLRLRLDHPPEFPQFGGHYQVTGFLDFGSDGLFRLPGSFDGLEPRDVVLDGLPQELVGDIYDASYIIHASALSNSPNSTPYSVVIEREVGEVEETSAALLSGEAFVSLEAAPQEEVLNATWTNGELVLVVGDEGRVFKHQSGEFYQMPKVVDSDLLAIHGFPNGIAYAVGENGVVTRFDGTHWHLLGEATDVALRAVWGSDPDDVYAVGKHRVVSFDSEQWDEMKTSFDLHDVSGNGPDDVWAVGDQGALLYNDGTGWTQKESPTERALRGVRLFDDGSLLLVGSGVAFMRMPGDKFTNLELDVDFVAATISGAGSDEFYLTGDGGKVARWRAGEGFTYLSLPTNFLAHDLAFLPSGEIIAVGSSALLLTPFIPFQIFDSPPDNGVLQTLLLDWHYQGDASPISLHTVAITLASGKSLWRLTVDGERHSVKLPNFEKLIGVNPLPGGAKKLRVYSAHDPEFSIDSFDFMQLGTSSWKSWAYDMIAFN